MQILPTAIPEVLIVEPDVFTDERGFFMETYHAERYGEMGVNTTFVQDNLSYSVKGTLRGLHFQYPNAQAKLVNVVQGEVFDVVADIRTGSPTFGQWVGVYLSADNKRQLFAPEGFAHGYCVLSETATFQYKCSNFYSPQDEKGVLWNDPGLDISWPIKPEFLSEKDNNYMCLKDIPETNLPIYEQL